MSGYWWKNDDDTLIDVLHKGKPVERSRHLEYYEPIEDENVHPSHWANLAATFNEQVDRNFPEGTFTSRGRSDYLPGIGQQAAPDGNHQWGSFPLCVAERMSRRVWDRYHDIEEATYKDEWDKRQKKYSRLRDKRTFNQERYMQFMYDLIIEEVPDMEDVLLNPATGSTGTQVTVSSMLTQGDDVGTGLPEEEVEENSDERVHTREK